MQLATWKRVALGAVVALSVAGGALAPVISGQAAADTQVCYYGRSGYFCYAK